MSKMKRFCRNYPRVEYGWQHTIGIRTVKVGYETPFGWGKVYWDFPGNTLFIYPIPFNWIVYIIREGYYRLSRVPDGIKEKSYADGYSKGVRDTYEIREEEIIRRIRDKFDD